MHLANGLANGKMHRYILLVSPNTKIEPPGPFVLAGVPEKHVPYASLFLYDPDRNLLRYEFRTLE